MFKTVMFITLLSASFVAMSVTKTLASLSFSGGGFTTVPAQCQDKKDNDLDGKIDYKNSSGVVQDLGCTSLTDNSENSTTTTASLAFSATTLAVSSLNAIFPVECVNDGTGIDCPRDLECSAFGKQAKGGIKFDNELRCTLTNITLGVRCNNKGDNASTANFNSAHVSTDLISESEIFPEDIDSKGKWSGVVTIAGSDIYYIANQLFPDATTCPNAANWYVDYSNAAILQANVIEQTFQNGALQNTLNLGTCVLIDYITGTYSCSQ